MATVLTRFEVLMPALTGDPTHDNAINTFIANMNTLCQLEVYDGGFFALNGYPAGNYQVFYYGLLTSTQTSTALGYLNTLNAALGFNVPCISFTVTQQP